MVHTKDGIVHETLIYKMVDKKIFSILWLNILD